MEILHVWLRVKTIRNLFSDGERLGVARPSLGTIGQPWTIHTYGDERHHKKIRNKESRCFKS
jgi:hypothetical protein